MSDRGEPPGERRHPSSERDELRTIAFRLREIQRLLAVRVEQENRRLAAEGIDPVTGHGFYHPGREVEGSEGPGRADPDEAGEPR